MSKILRRTVIARDSDLRNLMVKCARTQLYDRVEYEPLTYQELQNENLIRRLRDEDIPQHSPLPRLVDEILFRENSLYDRRYSKWDLTYDYPAGQIYVQSMINQPKQAMYRVYLERDYD